MRRFELAIVFVKLDFFIVLSQTLCWYKVAIGFERVLGAWRNFHKMLARIVFDRRRKLWFSGMNLELNSVEGAVQLGLTDCYPQLADGRLPKFEGIHRFSITE